MGCRTQDRTCNTSPCCTGSSSLAHKDADRESKRPARRHFISQVALLLVDHIRCIHPWSFSLYSMSR